MGGGRDARSGCVWLIRNSRVSSLRASEVLSVCARALAACCWRSVVSSSSSLEEKKLDDGWFRGVLGSDSGWEDPCQLRLFEVEMVVVRKGTPPMTKLDLLLHLSKLNKGQ